MRSDNLIFAECAALLEHFVHQRGFTMVNVCDDRNIPKIFSDHMKDFPFLKGIID